MRYPADLFRTLRHYASREYIRNRVERAIEPFIERVPIDVERLTFGAKSRFYYTCYSHGNDAPVSTYIGILTGQIDDVPEENATKKYWLSVFVGKDDKQFATAKETGENIYLSPDKIKLLLPGLTGNITFTQSQEGYDVIAPVSAEQASHIHRMAWALARKLYFEHKMKEAADDLVASVRGKTQSSRPDLRIVINNDIDPA